MDFSPHSLHHILSRIREQARCPQCGTPVSIEFPSVKVAAEDFMLLQLKCDTCSAFIVLHVNLRSAPTDQASPHAQLRNASSTIALSEEEMETLRTALHDAGGSFEALFQSNK